ncbi:MAG: thioredoxin-dependent thiol peroxidase [Bacteroidota bacterium]|nr:thioredoxin-dependent thiol peroxidase [Bacteroidota bacterium]
MSDEFSPKFKLHPGDPAPDFTTVDQHGNTVRLYDIPSKWIALFFYPEDNTPTCTKEACNLRDQFADFKKLDCTIFGISPDDEKSHQKFIHKFNLPYDLLVDTNHEIASTYNVWGRKKFMGREFDGIHRVSYILNSDKKVHKIIYPVVSAEHAEQIIHEIS